MSMSGPQQYLICTYLRLVAVQWGVRVVSLIESIVDGGRGCLVIPVWAADNDSLASNIMTTEAEVIGANGTIWADDASEVAGDVAVVANLVPRVAPQVVAEAA